MIIDARSLPEGAALETDVCIVGAGVAGITLAKELAGQSFRVALLESGGLEPDDEVQALYADENAGRPYAALDEARLRLFGGTSNHWAGATRPLDPIDFEVREGIADIGWPFSRTHLDPFYLRSYPYLGLSGRGHNRQAWETAAGAKPFHLDSERLETKIYEWSQVAVDDLEPVNFGEVYRQDVTKAPNITLYLYATLLHIETDGTGARVQRIRAGSLDGSRFWLASRIYVLAAGGIENARQLLLSGQGGRPGLGNQSDLVGRYFMEHPDLHTGIYVPSDELLLSDYLYFKDRGTTIQGRSVSATIGFADSVLEQERMLGLTFWFHPVTYGAGSLNRLLWERGDGARDLGAELSTLWSDFTDAGGYLVDRLVGDDEDPPDTVPVKIVSLRAIFEQAPNPASRVTLSSDRDAFGQSRARLEWRLSPIDKTSLLRAHEILAAELGRLGLGRIRLDLDADDRNWPEDLYWGFHHMGTTRMHADPKRGVADANCQVHGTANLFLAGSSVFPTAGSAPPTLTIVALTVRLADHIKTLMI